jgi:hypothetical protein
MKAVDSVCIAGNSRRSYRIVLGVTTGADFGHQTRVGGGFWSSMLPRSVLDLESQEIGKEFRAKLNGIFEFGKRIG